MGTALHQQLRVVVVLTSRQSRRQSSRLRGAKRLSGGGGQSLKLSSKAVVFKRVSLLIGGAKHVDGLARPVPPRRRPCW